MRPSLFVSAVIATAPLSTVFAEVDFARDIQPILNANCVECHGGVKAAGEVSFVYEDRVINFRGDSGNPVVTPGVLEDSELYYRVTTDDEDDRMPPAKDHPPLSEGEIALLASWIEEGAKWSGHWAFQSTKRSEVPETAFESRVRGDVDRFLFHRLEAEGLAPSDLEEPGRMLRRLSLGLTGLPPSLEELEAFEAAYATDSDGALEDAVDDLLSRPAFGERWATMWLDLIRYADSGGLGQDQKRTIWAYRDWVVQAFNDDLPFDQFTIKQLAGDLLPERTLADLVATASQRNTQTNDEGGTDDEEFRVEAVLDRVNTTWQTWGSITFSCVQCHDHPYDPIRHEEYYRFLAFYNNSADTDLSDDAPLLEVPESPDRYEEAMTLRERVLELKEAFWGSGQALAGETDWTGLKSLAVESNNSTEYTVVEYADYDEFHTVGTVAIKTHTLIDAPASSFGKEPMTALRLTVLPHDLDTAIDNSEWGFIIDDLEAWVESEDGSRLPVCFRASLPDVPWMPTDPMGRVGSNGANWGANSQINYERTLVLVPEAPIDLAEGERFALRIHCDEVGQGSFPMAIQRGRLACSSDPRWTEWSAPGSDAYRWSLDIADASERLKAIPGTTVPIMLERPEELARRTRIFERGNAMDKGDRVFAGLPASLVETESGSSYPDRLDMARWWASKENPLTARVFVNRLWEQLFGVGIVPTLEDFGSSGEKPTHPELLDYLAVRFQDDYQWSVKAILREITLSYAYQQSSRVTPQLLERDPDNRLVARGPRLRLTAEMVRDQALAASGLISLKRGGPPVHPPLPEGVWQPFLSKDLWETPERGEPDRYRRSLYTYVKRSIPFPTFAAFDAPSREFCNPRRLSSNTPLQALVTLNDAVFVECAEALGGRIANTADGDLKAGLAQAHRMVTGRPPSQERIDKLYSLYEDANLQSPEQAWTVVAQVLLNLDETLTY